jgi:SAM-dependent methyltransferase
MFMDRTHAAMRRNGDQLLALGGKVFTLRGRPVLDIGCGYGRLAYALHRTGFEGTYVGLDILPRHISWLRQNFSSVAANFSFQHLDIRNDRYNPKGALPADGFQIPEMAAPDAIFVLSIFTHMYERDLLHYLDQIAARMDPLTIAYCTFFLDNPEMRRLEALNLSHYPMRLRLSDHCWYHDQADPLHAICYDEQWLRGQLTQRGLAVAAAFYGKWCGRPGAISGQDALFLAKMA